MGIKKKKISELPLAQSLVGLFTIGVNKVNESVKVDLEFVKTAADNATAAASSATSAATSATNTATSANLAANEANTKAGFASTAAGVATRAAENAQTQATDARLTIVRLEELEKSLVAQYKMIPTGMTLDYPLVVTMRNPVEQRIKYALTPTNTGRNVLFLGDDNAISVFPDGEFKTNKPGISKIHVIPTENTSLYQTVTITVVEPTLRKLSANSLCI
ncbi:MAG: hypothetical protein RSA66_10550, partial [Muribaculaceae bacterium]